MDLDWARKQLTFTNRKDEKECIKDLFAARPNAERYNTVRNLLKLFKERDEEIGEEYCQLEDEFKSWPFNRKSDAWEIIDGHFIWYEVDGSHMTTCDKVHELSTIADIVAERFHLFIYDVKFDASYFFDTNRLSWLWGELELGVHTGVIRWDSALPKTMPCTAKSFGMNFDIIRF